MTGRTNARVVLILLTALAVFIYYVPLGQTDFVGRWGGGSFGVAFPRSGGAGVASVAPGSPAWKAGIRPGDRLVLPPFSPVWAAVAFPYAGERVSLPIARGPRTFTATMIAAPVAGFGLAQRIGGILAILPATIFLVIAFALVYLRPGVMTWSFYVYALGYFSTTASLAYFQHVLLRPAYITLFFVLATLFGNFSAMPLLPFVLRFPSDDLRGWRRKLDPFVWAAIVLSFGAYVYQWVVLQSMGEQPAFADALNEWLPLAVFAAATAIVLKNYKEASPQIRQRTGFLFVGVIVSFVAYALYFVPSVPVEVAQVAGFFVVFMPIAVAYAAFQHRVIDINFVLNRALVYGAFSIVILVFISILDWFTSRTISQEHLAAAIELSATIAIGFLLNRLARTFETWVDLLLFRRRHDAERYLTRVAAALPYATSEEAITDGLAHEPAHALHLTAAALYRKAEGGDRYAGVGTAHGTDVAPMGFGRNDMLVRFLQADERIVWLDQIRSHLDRETSALYVVAVPVTVRHELVAFTLYGAHQNGAQIDPEEIVLLENMAREAARAYDHIDAVRTREMLDRLKAVPAGTT